MSVRNPQPSSSPRPVSGAELELFHDRELDEAVSRELDERMPGDAPLRARLGRVREIDALTLQAILSRSTARFQERTARRFIPALALVLVFGVAAVIFANLWPKKNPVPALTATEPTVAVNLEEDRPLPEILKFAAKPAAPVKALFSLSMPEPQESTQATQLAAVESPDTTDADSTAPQVIATAATRPVATARQTVAQFERSLARGDVAGGAELVAQADDSTKREIYQRLGAVIRSADTAARVLDRLPGEVAVDVCTAWLEAGEQRPLAIKHMSRRAQDAALRDRVHTALHDLLEEKPELRPWMVSYANWAITTEPPAKGDGGAMRWELMDLETQLAMSERLGGAWSHAAIT